MNDTMQVPPLADATLPNYVQPTLGFRDPGTRLDFLSGLEVLQAEIFAINTAKGFWKEELTPTELAEQLVGTWPRSTPELAEFVRRARETAPHNKGEKLMLMVSELAEQLEAIREGRAAQPCEKDSEITCEEEEVADLAIRLLDYCGKNKLRLGYAILRKVEKNRTRPPKHNKLF